MRLDPRSTAGKLALAALAAGLSIGCKVEDRQYAAKEATATRERAAPEGTSINHPEDRPGRRSLPAGYRGDRGIGDGGELSDGERDRSDELIRSDPAAARFARELPGFSLADPTGARHDRDSLVGPHGVVLVVTTPTFDEGDAQEGWNVALQASAPGGARWILVEDMSQAMFAGRALDSMKEEFDPQKNPLILVDEDGQLRRQLGVGEGETVVLAYDHEGTLVHADESGEPDAQRAQAAWATLGIEPGTRGKDRGAQPGIERE